MQSVVILSKPDDLHAIAVARCVTKLGGTCKIVDSEWPDDAPIEIRFDASGPTRKWSSSIGDTGFGQETSVWWRRAFTPAYHPDVKDVDIQQFVQAEKKYGLHGAILASNCRIVNDPKHELLARSKPLQLRLATEAGFCIPGTCVTNSAEKAARFIAELKRRGKRAICKPLTVPRKGLAETKLVTEKDLSARELSIAPVIFQECIERGTDIRICVVGDELFAASLVTRDSKMIDWRMDPTHTAAPYALPQSISLKVKRFMERIGLMTGSIDLRQSPEGEFIFFEVNPSGQFLWLEADTGAPICNALSRLLLGLK